MKTNALIRSLWFFPFQRKTVLFYFLNLGNLRIMNHNLNGAEIECFQRADYFFNHFRINR